MRSWATVAAADDGVHLVTYRWVVVTYRWVVDEQRLRLDTAIPVRTE